MCRNKDGDERGTLWPSVASSAAMTRPTAPGRLRGAGPADRSSYSAYGSRPDNSAGVVILLAVPGNVLVDASVERAVSVTHQVHEPVSVQKPH